MFIYINKVKMMYNNKEFINLLTLIFMIYLLFLPILNLYQ